MFGTEFGILFSFFFNGFGEDFFMWVLSILG